MPDIPPLHHVAHIFTNISCVIADTLQVGSGLDNGNDQTQIAGGWPTCCKNAATLFINADLEMIHLVVVVRDFQVQRTVPADHRLDRIGKLRFNESTHGQHIVAQIFQVFIEATGYVM